MRMRLSASLSAIAILLGVSATVPADDSRQHVSMPEPMQAHMLANMRDHMQTLDAILSHLAAKEWNQAAEMAEQRLGMSSLDAHGAAHMAGSMPKARQAMGTEMHRAASRFALLAQEGDLPSAVAALRKVTAACVACHAAYRIR